MSEYDGFDSMLEDMLRLAERLFSESLQPASNPARQVQEKAEPDELIESRDRFTYILNAPGYQQDQLLVSVLDDEIVVKAPDFAVKKHLAGRVDPGTAESKYRNGVLSVTVRKR